MQITGVQAVWVTDTRMTAVEMKIIGWMGDVYRRIKSTEIAHALDVNEDQVE